MNFKEYFLTEDVPSLNKTLKNSIIPIVNKTFNGVSIEVCANDTNSYGIYYGICGTKTRTSAGGWSVKLADDTRAVALFDYICDEIKGLVFEGLSFQGIRNLINKTVSPIVKKFQLSGNDEENSSYGLADRIDGLQMSNKIKNTVLQQLDDLDEFLPPEAMTLSDRDLMDFVVWLYNHLNSADDDIISFIKGLKSYQPHEDTDKEENEGTEDRGF